MKLTSEKNVVVYNPADKTIKILKKITEKMPLCAEVLTKKLVDNNKAHRKTDKTSVNEVF